MNPDLKMSPDYQSNLQGLKPKSNKPQHKIWFNEAIMTIISHDWEFHPNIKCDKKCKTFISLLENHGFIS